MESELLPDNVYYPHVVNVRCECREKSKHRDESRPGLPLPARQQGPLHIIHRNLTGARVGSLRSRS